MTGFPTINVLIAFTTPYSTSTPTWVDVTAYALSFHITRGRTGADEVCNPGTLTLTLDNTDGRFDPDNTTGPYYGYIRPQRRVRITTTISGTDYYLFSGYVDAWTRTWPGGATFSVTTLAATDRFKLLAKKTTGALVRVQEQAHLRMTALLDDAGVPSTSYSINADAYNTRTVVAHTYDGGDALSNCQDVARSDGGAFFTDGQGKVIFQSTRFRTDNTRSTVSAATFGNATGAIPVEDSIDPTVDDSLMANRVLVTDGAGSGAVHIAEDTTAQGVDGVLELDLGTTLLRALDAPDRASDVLLLRKDPRPRYDAFTVDLLSQATSDQVLIAAREISDRVTLAVTPSGGGTAMSRDQYVEGVEHDVDIVGSRWAVTFPISGAYGGARVLP